MQKNVSKIVFHDFMKVFPNNNSSVISKKRSTPSPRALIMSDFRVGKGVQHDPPKLDVIV